jgi:malate synthase
VLALAERLLGLPEGTVRTTVLIETLPAAFEMEEILHALGPHAGALNAGRWDYLFSAIKTFSAAPQQHVLPDRNGITMEVPFLRAYTELLVSTCHRRGAHAIGGMAAFVPDRRDPERTRRALDKVRQDKEREARDGFDGSWVAHPGLVETCRKAFDEASGGRPNQLHRLRRDVLVTAADLLDVASAPGRPTAAGLRTGISVALRYLQGWLAGSGAVTVDSLMEDAATVEIIRSQVWQQVRAGTRLDDGTRVSAETVAELVEEEVARLVLTGGTEYLRDAARLFLDVATAEPFVPFFTTVAYSAYIAHPTCDMAPPPRRTAQGHVDLRAERAAEAAGGTDDAAPARANGNGRPRVAGPREEPAPVPVAAS